jgi:hypothetical protein
MALGRSSSPISPPPNFSDSSDEEYIGPPEATSADAGTPDSNVGRDAVAPDDVATCRWSDCGMTFTHLPSLVEHIQNGRYEFV